MLCACLRTVIDPFVYAKYANSMFLQADNEKYGFKLLNVRDAGFMFVPSNVILYPPFHDICFTSPDPGL